MSLTSETELTMPNTKHPFLITVDASLIGLGAVLFQLNEQNKMKVLSYNSRILNPQEQKLSTLDRELLGIVHALQIHEFLIIGSPHPIHIFTEHKPLLHCFTKKGNLSPRFYRAQMQLTKYSKLKIIHTPGKNLSVADMLSRSTTKAELQLNHFKHKQLPPQIDFTLLQNDTLKPVHYLIKHEEILPHQKHDSQPILADYGTDQFSIRINDKGNDIVVKPLQSFSFKSVTPFQTKFKTPIRKINNHKNYQKNYSKKRTKNYHNLHFTTTPQNHFFPSVPHTYFATKFRTNFNFIEVFTEDKPDICATIIQNPSKHMPTLHTGHIGYFEVPITNEKPKFFQVNDINALKHNVTHTYHPEITEPVPQTNYIVHYDDPTTSPPQFSLHQNYMTNSEIPNQSSPLYNVQPTSHTSEKRIFPSLPYTSENLKFINKFNFQFSDLTDTEYITLCNMLLKYKTCYATHKNDVGKTSTPFRIRLEPNAQLMTQRPSKVPIHYRDKLNALLEELEKYNIIKQIESSPQDKPVHGTTYINPLIIIPKGDTIKCVLDARHLIPIQNNLMNHGLLNLSLHS